MARTKAEIRAFLDSKVGTVVPHPGYYDLRGQCVTLTKALMEFLGVPSPYAARGNAITAGDAYIAQGLGTPGRGWLTIVVNRDMGYIQGVHYGHIWIDLLDEANYESNGSRALVTTKNTRPITQGQQFINFDKWIIKEGGEEVIIGNDQGWRDRMNRFHRQLVMNADMSDPVWEAVRGKELSRVLIDWSDHSNAQLLIAYQELGELASRDRWQQQIKDRTGERDGALKALNAANAEVQQLRDKIAELGEGISKEELAELEAKIVESQAKAKAAQDALDAKIAADAKADEVGQGFLRWLINKITGGR